MNQTNLINEIALSTVATQTHHRIVEVVKVQEVDQTNNTYEIKILKKKINEVLHFLVLIFGLITCMKKRLYKQVPSSF